MLATGISIPVYYHSPKPAIPFTSIHQSILPLTIRVFLLPHYFIYCLTSVLAPVTRIPIHSRAKSPQPPRIVRDLWGGFARKNFNAEEAIRFGSQIGVVCIPETRAERRHKWRGFLRIRVLIDVTQPLSPGFDLTRENRDPVWIQFKYERLQNFCYKCGRVSHTERNCGFPGRMIVHDEKQNLGPWMKAVPLSRFQLPAVEHRPSNPEADEFIGGRGDDNRSQGPPERNLETTGPLPQEYTVTEELSASSENSTENLPFPDFQGHSSSRDLFQDRSASDPTSDTDGNLRRIFLQIVAEAEERGVEIEQIPRYWEFQQSCQALWAGLHSRPNIQTHMTSKQSTKPSRASFKRAGPSRRSNGPSSEVSTTIEGAVYFVTLPEDEGDELNGKHLFNDRNYVAQATKHTDIDEELVINLKRLTLKRAALPELEFNEGGSSQEGCTGRKKARREHLVADSFMGSAERFPKEEEVPQGPPQYQ